MVDPKKKDEFEQVDKLDHNGNPIEGEKVRSGGEVTAEPQPPGGGPPGRNPKPQEFITEDHKRQMEEDEERKKDQRPAKKK